MVGVTVSTVIAASDEDAVERGSTGDSEIQLMPVTVSGVSPRYPVVRLG